MGNQGERYEISFLAMAGSGYHLTKRHDSANLHFAHTQFDVLTFDLRTHNVRTGTDEIEADPRSRDAL